MAGTFVAPSSSSSGESGGHTLHSAKSSACLSRFDAASVGDRYTQYCAEMNAQGGPSPTAGGTVRGYVMSFQPAERRTSDEAIAAALLRAAEDALCHFLVVGIDGMAHYAHKGPSSDGAALVMGSVSDAVVRKALYCNVVCVQNLKDTH
jgi:hypothetical protein